MSSNALDCSASVFEITTRDKYKLGERWPLVQSGRSTQAVGRRAGHKRGFVAYRSPHYLMQVQA